MRVFLSLDQPDHPAPRRFRARITPIRANNRRAAERRHQDLSFHSRLLFRRHVLGLRELGDIGSGILERDELATIGQRDRIVKPALPAARHAFVEVSRNVRASI